LSFEKVCKTGLSSWWSKVFDDLGGTPTNIKYKYDKISMIYDDYHYIGGTVIEPKKGIYHDLKIVDVVSLYPSMAIINNVCFDAINCECCATDSNANVPSEVLNKKKYWICKRKVAAYGRYTLSKMKETASVF
jgi:DNA polymerase elongation subunit (family B)